MISSLVKSSKHLAAATTVLCFGDSWTDGNADALEHQLKNHGHSSVKVINKDYWGSTAEYFANNPRILPDTVQTYNPEYVLLSMGGNDFKNIYWRQKQYVTPWTAVAGIEKNIRVVLDALYKEHPDIKVVTYGYDFPGDVEHALSGKMWDRDKEVSSSMKAFLWLYNFVGIRVINYSAMQYGNTLEKLAKEYSAKGYSLTYVPLWGSLQSASAGKPDAPSPVLGKPSPYEFMRDPIHANKQGYRVLMGNLYNAYFGRLLTQTPTAIAQQS